MDAASAGKAINGSELCRQVKMPPQSLSPDEIETAIAEYSTVRVAALERALTRVALGQYGLQIPYSIKDRSDTAGPAPFRVSAWLNQTDWSRGRLLRNVDHSQDTTGVDCL